MCSKPMATLLAEFNAKIRNNGELDVKVIPKDKVDQMIKDFAFEQ